MKERFLWVDYTKLIGIYLVVLGHLQFISDSLMTWIYSFHMPLFFVLSGLFARPDNSSFSCILKKNAQALLKPYIVFSLISYVWWLFAKFIPNCNQEELSVMDFLIQPILGVFLGEGRYTSFSFPINTPLWFLVGLFFCRIFFQIISNSVKEKHLTLILILTNIFIIVFFALFKKPHYSIFSILSALLCFPFYTFGYFYNKQKNATTSKSRLFILILLSLIVGGVLSIYNGRVDVAKVIFGHNILLFYFIGIINTFGVVMIAKSFFVVRNSFLLYLGVNTLIILGFQDMLIFELEKIVNFCGFELSKGMPFANLIGSIEALVILAVSIIPIYLVRKYLPFVIGLKAKQRDY